MPTSRPRLVVQKHALAEPFGVAAEKRPEELVAEHDDGRFRARFLLREAAAEGRCDAESAEEIGRHEADRDDEGALAPGAQAEGAPPVARHRVKGPALAKVEHVLKRDSRRCSRGLDLAYEYEPVLFWKRQRLEQQLMRRGQDGHHRADAERDARDARKEKNGGALQRSFTVSNTEVQSGRSDEGRRTR